MELRRKAIYSWMIFILLLLAFLAVVWVVYHREPAPPADYDGRVTPLLHTSHSSADHRIPA
jgi:cbb3-type cytochrome oxidase subunit 3